VFDPQINFWLVDSYFEVPTRPPFHPFPFFNLLDSGGGSVRTPIHQSEFFFLSPVGFRTFCFRVNFLMLTCFEA